MATSLQPPGIAPQRSDPDFSHRPNDYENRRNNREQPEHGKNGNIGVPDENPD
jgi:hypothetical protein